MEELAMEIPKRQRMDSYGGRSGPSMSVQQVQQQQQQQPQPQPPQQHFDPQIQLPMHGAHGRSSLPLNPPGSYRNQPPHSPYQVPPPPSIPEQIHGGAYAQSQSQSQPGSEPEMKFNPRSAPPEQTTFARSGTVSNPRSPKSAHIPRPLETSFDNAPHHYPSQPPADLVESSLTYPGPETPVHASHYAMRPGPSPYEAQPGHPPPHAMAHHYSEAEMAQVPPQGYHPSYNAPPQAAGWAQYNAAQAPRKHNRAIQACDTCRQRKVKCDEGKPKCHYCRENDQNCTYKEIQPPKADRIQKEIVDGQDVIKGELQELRSEMKELKSLLKNLKQQPPQHETPLSEPGTASSIPNATQVSLQQLSVQPPEVEEEAPVSGDQAPQPRLEVDHSVGVHRLLRWGSIQNMLSYPETLRAFRVSDIKQVKEDFVLQAEQRKGVLRVYGRGQGQDRYEGTRNYQSHPSTPTTADDPTGNGSAGGSPPDVWGYGLGKPNDINGRYSSHAGNDHPGGLLWDGSLQMDSATMDILLNSYLDNLHVMHPFLSRVRLKRMFDRVRVQTNPQLHPGGAAYFEPKNHSRKRKFSNSGSPMDGPGRDNVNSLDEPFIERRVSTAIVLMVMALGKICLAKKPLLGPVPDVPRDSSSTVTPSPFAHGSPCITASPLRIKSPATASFGRRSSQQGSLTEAAPTDGVWRNDRNVDVIPGLAYYAKGAEILGTLQGGNGLPHVQAMLLASLYCGQLASSIEAWSWLSQAGRACLFLMRGAPFDNDNDERRDPVRLQLIYFAYWTCFQFEGDILAELDLQPSGIERLHKKIVIPFPNIIPEESNDNGQPDRIMLYYTFQLHLRKSLNDIQPFLYPPDAWLKARKVESMLHDRFGCRVAIHEWREILSHPISWDDHNHLTSDILDARLRAKYYGTVYIINRPLLEYALHKMSGEVPDEVQKAMRAYRDAPLQSSKTMQPETSEMEIYRACVDCIEAAKRSTTAFDGIILDPVTGELRNRLIVTNIVGTAHAQFGNMLVLSVVYKSRLGFMIGRSEIIRLLERTIGFLQSHRPISYTLGHDAAILAGILHNIDKPLPSVVTSLTSSFSSSM